MTETAATGTVETPATKADKDVTPENLPELVKELLACHVEALAACEGVSDGGTCNFDAPVLSVKSRRLAAAAITIAGGHSFEWKLWKRVQGLVLGFSAPGQGFRRTRYAEAFSKALQARGWTSSVYYQCD